MSSNEVKHPPIVITGMHRSGTSLVASMLGALSVRLGEHLLAPDSNNEEGYFEDLGFLDFHRRVLSRLSVPSESGHHDWGWTESERLDVNRLDDFRDEARRLIAERADQPDPWGWKDPRTTLFLDFWDNLLEEARYVFVYRFPWDVADSMQRLGAEVFLRNPEYAYRIWSFYNKRIRDFYATHSDRCLLVSINALQKNLKGFVDLLSNKLGVPIRDSGLANVFKGHLFRTIGGQDPLIDLVAAVWADCIRLLSELDEMADISGYGLWQVKPVKSRMSRLDRKDGQRVDVSVVMPCYEQGTLLIEAVASVERHAPPHSELIIINDGSQQPRTVEILEILKSFGYFVVDQENAGLSAARNRAISLANGRYILPLDDDNRMREGFVDEAIDVLNSSPEVGVVYGYRNDFGLRKASEQVPEFDLATLLKENYIDACAVFRKQVWLDCGGYDQEMSPAEDWELWIHAAERGWSFHRIPHITFDYRVRPGSLISRLTPSGVLELAKKIRIKHSELYWSMAVEELETARRLLAEQIVQHERQVETAQIQKSEFELVRSQLQNELSALHSEARQAYHLNVSQQAEIARLHGKVEACESQILARDDVIGSMQDKLEELSKSNELLSSGLSTKTSELDQISRSLGWRLLSRYGVVKYRYLLPVCAMFGIGRFATKARKDRGASKPLE